MTVKVQPGFDLIPAPIRGPNSSTSSSSAELRILLAAGGARRGATGNCVDEIKAGCVDWQRLLKMADWHGIKPLLLQYLGQLPAAPAPDGVIAALRQDSRQAAVRNLALAAELLRVSRELRSRGIEHLSYKGPLLASELYGNLALRVSADLDIVVAKAKLAEACKALVEIGYTDKHGFTASQRAAAFRFGFEHTFRSPAGIDVDLHWRLVPTFVSPSLDESGLWRRAIETPLSGQMVPTFCPEDLLFALCLHAGQHEWKHISIFCDLARTLDRYPALRWEVVRRHLRDSNTTRIVLVSLCLTRTHWRMELPRDLASQIDADNEVQSTARTVQSVFWPATNDPLPSDTSIRWILQRTMRERHRDRLRYLAGIALNPTSIDYETFRLPHGLMALYPLLRGGRLALKHRWTTRTR